MRLSSLVRIAHGFDCAVLVRFVPFSEFAVSVASPRPERMIACSYESEARPLTRATMLPPSQALVP